VTRLTPEEQHLLLIAIGYYQDGPATELEDESLNAVIDKLELRPLEA
jgi:hypothetical protein